MKRIEEFSTEELADEFLKRFDHAVAVGKRVRTNKVSTFFRKTIGDAHVCIGICEDFKISLVYGLWRGSQSIKGEDA